MQFSKSQFKKLSPGTIIVMKSAVSFATSPSKMKTDYTRMLDVDSKLMYLSRSDETFEDGGDKFRVARWLFNNQIIYTLMML